MPVYDDFELSADEDLIDGVGFADPGGRSALRASTGERCPRRACQRRVGVRDLFCKSCGAELNPRMYPCPTCGAKNVLTRIDVQRHYQCDRCADRLERGGW